MCPNLEMPVNVLYGAASLPVLLFMTSCGYQNAEMRSFTTSFEDVADFDSFYLTPQGHLGTTYHELSDVVVHSGEYAHRSWITGANPPSTSSENNNHRGYPTVQLQNTPMGSFESPVYITFWVWLDMSLEAHEAGEDDWFSFATFTDDTSDSWSRTVLVNLSHDGFVHLQHVPRQGQQEHVYQTTSLLFPQREWVELRVFLDFTNDGYAKVWQNGELVSHANVERTKNRLSQAHFGMYCSPQIASGVVYNDDLSIEMVSAE